MKIYHGTNTRFGVIDLEKCPPDRDFGQAFYTTSIQHHAERRAEDIVRKTKQGEVVIFEYDFDFDEILKINPTLKIKRFDDICSEWAEFVMFNRLRRENEMPHDFDTVEGPVADDKMFRQFQLYATNRIKLKDFVVSLKYDREKTHQIAFCTEQAIDAMLEYNEPPRYRIEGLIADLSVALIQKKQLSKIEAMSLIFNSAVFRQLSDYNTKLYKKSWQDIYELLSKELKP